MVLARVYTRAAADWRRARDMLQRSTCHSQKKRPGRVRLRMSASACATCARISAWLWLAWLARGAVLGMGVPGGFE